MAPRSYRVLTQIKVPCDFFRHMATMLIAPLARRSPDLGIRTAKIALTICASLLLAGCGQKKESPGEQVWHYEVRGLVRNTPPDHQAIEVEHEDIPGFMPAMTMPFIARDAQEIAQLQIGDAISFRLNVTQRDSWIDQVRKIDANQLHLPIPKPVPAANADAAAGNRLREGDMMPAFELRDQDGKPVTLDTFRGHPFVVTFIFTRCPVPNFCPRMSQNFAELQKAIQASSDLLAATRLLSISFDPKFDTPEILKQYAQHAGADPAVWTFATGDPKEIQSLTSAFSVLVQPESGTLSHSLATALIDRRREDRQDLARQRLDPGGSDARNQGEVDRSIVVAGGADPGSRAPGSAPPAPTALPNETSVQVWRGMRPLLDERKLVPPEGLVAASAESTEACRLGLIPWLAFR